MSDELIADAKSRLDVHRPEVEIQLRCLDLQTGGLRYERVGYEWVGEQRVAATLPDLSGQGDIRLSIGCGEQVTVDIMRPQPNGETERFTIHLDGNSTWTSELWLG